MTVLVGIDIQAVDEVRESMEEFGLRYLGRIYTDQEIADSGSMREVAASRLAERFAAKEAVFKVLDVGDAVPLWKEIEIHRRGAGHPEIVLTGVAAEVATRQGIETMSLSLSHSGGFAAAAVIADVFHGVALQ